MGVTPSSPGACQRFIPECNIKKWIYDWKHGETAKKMENCINNNYLYCMGQKDRPDCFNRLCPGAIDAISCKTCINNAKDNALKCIQCQSQSSQSEDELRTNKSSTVKKRWYLAPVIGITIGIFIMIAIIIYISKKRGISKLMY